VFLRCRERGIELPSEGTVRTRINRLSPAVVTSRRTTAYTARQRFGPKVGHLPGADYPYAVIEIDHTPLDLILVDDIHRQPIGRPFLTLAIDVFSRTVAGFHLALESPSSTSVALCLAHAILPKDTWCAERSLSNNWPVQGLMDCVHCDNGREFHSRALERACEQYGIRLQHRPVRQPHYGAHIERLLGTFAIEIHAVPGTTKSNPAERGDYDSDKHACMTLKECECWLAEFITGVYHQRIHSALGVPPLVKYQEAISGGQVAAHRLDLSGTDPLRLRLDFMPFFERVVQPTGIHIDGIDYYHDVLRTWIAAADPDDPTLHRKFIVRRDPRDISRVYFYDPGWEQYFEIPYRDRSRPVMSLWELHAAQESLRQQGRECTDQNAVFNSIERLRQQQEDAAEKTRRARREAQKRRLTQGADRPNPDTEAAAAPGFTGAAPEPFDDIGDALG
jgi:putative transposase